MTRSSSSSKHKSRNKLSKYGNMRKKLRLPTTSPVRSEIEKRTENLLISETEVKQNNGINNNDQMGGEADHIVVNEEDDKLY